MTIDLLKRQLDISWGLLSYHLDGLGEDECLWRPAQVGLHVVQDADGAWHPDWPDHEGYDIGPPSIAWTMWHIMFWWSMTLNHSFGDGSLTREHVSWEGSGTEAKATIVRLYDEWRVALDQLTDADLSKPDRTHWPIQERPFGEVVAWLNVELMKNAAEIGYTRFLYGAKAR